MPTFKERRPLGAPEHNKAQLPLLLAIRHTPHIQSCAKLVHTRRTDDWKSLGKQRQILLVKLTCKLENYIAQTWVRFAMKSGYYLNYFQDYENFSVKFHFVIWLVGFLILWRKSVLLIGCVTPTIGPCREIVTGAPLCQSGPVMIMRR